MIVIVVTLVLVPRGQAQGKYNTLYKFTGGKDGNSPQAELIFDNTGNLYGTTMYSGPECGSDCGTVFRLAPNPNGSWTESVLYTFTGNADGANPVAGLVFDHAGNLFGTTLFGSYGKVFELTPNLDGSWTEDVLYTFNGVPDGAFPNARLIFDQAGKLYSTAYAGGGKGGGTIFNLTPNPDGSWTESTLYSFGNGVDGYYPSGGLIFDTTGNLYGTTHYGGTGGCSDGDFRGCGVVFKLTADGNWTENVLYGFTGGKDGAYPLAGLIFDKAGNLYGTSEHGGNLSYCNGAGCGVVFKLTPNPGGSWTEKVLRRFTGGRGGAYPLAGLIFDHAGNLYGTTYQGGNLSYCGGAGCGVVFELARNPNGGWKETVLHRFADHPGALPHAGLILDGAGNLYGTTQGDGTTTFGSVFEITP
jgi:uncharacterized repeat protein (TIGR03803 family)